MRTRFRLEYDLAQVLVVCSGSQIAVGNQHSKLPPGIAKRFGNQDRASTSLMTIFRIRFIRPTNVALANELWTILTGVDFSSAGCWRNTGEYLGQTLSFVVQTIARTE